MGYGTVFVLSVFFFFFILFFFSDSGHIPFVSFLSQDAVSHCEGRSDAWRLCYFPPQASLL
jgi:Fe2+ transport system protein B